MRNFFFPALGPEKRGLLQTAGVPFCNLDTRRESGIVVEEGDLQRLLEVLGAVVECQGTTEFEGIFRLSLKFGAPVVPAAPPPPRKNVAVIGGWDGQRQADFVRLAEEILLPVLGRDVVIDVPHGRPLKPISDGRFYIHFWSGPDQKCDVKASAPERIWGIPVSCRDSNFKPTGLGVAIVDDGGWPVAELIVVDAGENLYIHHDLCHEGTENELKIWRRLLEEVVAELRLSPEAKALRAKKLAEERKQRSRTNYTAECGKRFNRTLNATKQAIKDGHANIERLQVELVRTVRETSGAERKLEQLEACRGVEMEKFEREFDRLLSVPAVREVQAEGGLIKVFTDTLYATDPRSGKRHEIGAFRIEINTDGRGDGVRWFNLTRQIDAYERGMQAPHVFHPGHACLGNHKEVFPQLIGSYEFSIVAMLAIRFVESANTDDTAGRHIDRWPVAS